jgi:hypothetical protein
MSEVLWDEIPLRRLSDYRTDWERLNRSASPILSIDFFLISIRYFDRENVRCMMARDRSTQQIIAITLVCITGWGVGRTYQPSQAPIGCWLQSPEVSTKALITALMPKLSAWPLGFSITQQDPNVSVINDIESNETLPYITIGHVPCIGTFEEYWASRGKNLRQNTNKSANRMAKEGYELAVKRITEADQMPEAVTRYATLEAQSWKADGATAVAPDNDQGQFYIDLLSDYANREQAMVFELWANEELIVSELCILNDEELIILKTTYNETFQRFSPASILRKQQFEYIFDQTDLKRVEFYGKMMDWHYRWTDITREMVHINLFSKTGQLLKRVKGYLG